jgi:hypothetical protein
VIYVGSVGVYDIDLFETTATAIPDLQGKVSLLFCFGQEVSFNAEGYSLPKLYKVFVPKGPDSCTSVDDTRCSDS